LCRSGGVHFKRADRAVRNVDAHDGENTVGGERANEEVFAALPVVDKLAADGAIHVRRLFVKLAEVVNAHAGAVFAETVGKDAVGRNRAAKIENGTAHGRDGTDRFDFDGFSGGVLDRNLNVGVGLVGITAKA